MLGRFVSVQVALSNRERDVFESSVAVVNARVLGVVSEGSDTTALESAQYFD